MLTVIGRVDMKRPFALSVWFMSCVCCGLFLAWMDGVAIEGILRAALAAAMVGLALAAIAWAVNTVREAD